MAEQIDFSIQFDWHQMVVSFAVKFEWISAHVLLNFMLRHYTRPKLIVLRRDLFVCTQWYSCRHHGYYWYSQTKPSRIVPYSRGRGSGSDGSICNTRSQKEYLPFMTPRPKIEKKIFQKRFWMESPVVTYYQVFFWCCAKVITFMVGSVITFMVKCYYIYG